MGKIKVHELAKELDLSSKEIIEKATALNIEIKSHLSSLEDSEVEKIKKSLQKTEKKEKEAKDTENKKQAKKEKKDEPVIIRREVIVSEEELAKREEEEKKKKLEAKSKNVGFVQRNQNKDFNIVYRNKVTKPLTVDELFGLKPKEEKKKPEEKKVVEEIPPVIEEKVEKAEIKTEKKNESETMIETRQKIEKKPEFNKQNNDFSRTRNNYNNEQRGNNRNNFQRNNGYNNNNGGYRGNNNNNGNNGFRNNTNKNSYHNNNQGGYRNNHQNNDGYNRGRRPLDEKGIEKNIKNIMATEIVEKENVREYGNKQIDKQKNNRYEEAKAKRGTKRKSGRFSEEINEKKLNSLKQESSLSNMFSDQEGGMLDYYDLTTERGRKGKRKVKQNEERNKQKIFELKEITIPETISVKDLAAELKKTSGEVIKKLLGYGIMATINNELDFDTAFLVAGEFGVTANKKETVTEEDILFDDSEDKEEDLKPRPPVVVVMGHVDHGKTSLLDAVRSTNVIEGEAGGITQHIGAYKVNVNGREITFLDTPGHEAFTSMRARGAQITDIAILVVAADDGVMPQTIEAINHAKAAEIPIIVAVNKMDLPDANVDKIKQELMKYELVPEEWGGDTIFVPISAKKHQNIDQLLEMVLLVADMKELKANPNKQAKGVVIEARLDKAKGPIASMLVQRGTLDVGDTIIVGSAMGRIRAMKNDKGQRVKKAGPSTPVEVMGLTEVPEAGETFYEVKDEKTAKHLMEKRKRQEREKAINATTKVTLDNLFSQMEKGNLKQLNLIVKADVQGTVEAVKQSLEKLSNEEVVVKVIHSAAGSVTESDVTLAKVSNAIIIAFNVRPGAIAKDMAKKEEVEIKQYSVIYQAIEDVESAMKGMLDPTFEEKVIGTAEVRQTFKVSGVGTIAGGYVLDGKLERNAGVRVIRENVVIHEGKLASLKRFKDDVKEVAKGYECGLQIENYNDIKEMDIIEAFVMEEVKK
ncbi:MAG: translation initiation factor IF-2 [Clostridia bacterium]